MSDRPHLPGPSRETLEKLHADLPGMVKDVENQRIFRGQKSTKLAKPTKCCAICGKGFDLKVITSGLPDVSLCPTCQENLNKRLIAFVCDNRFAFIDISACEFGPPPELEPWRGKIVQCGVDEMDRLQLKFKVQSLERQKLIESMMEPPKDADTN